MRKVLPTSLAVLFAFAVAAVAEAANYKIDPVHSFVTFQIKHLGVGHAWGRFNDPTGTLSWDENDLGNSRIEVTLQSAKVDTGNQKRDDHLRSPDFFNARQFPTITFQSTAIRKIDDDRYEMTGDLTLHGTTKPVTVELVKVGEADTRSGSRLGLDAKFTIKRSEFGMNFMLDGLGDEVTVFAALQGIRG